ncbi:unnamed protein product [Peronospora belbahrii]|uniref:Uncharacterized protein n=1 Tax=Peronospora belbahrii TaxID=622444 RepID=A0ABN8CN22_9STRA|nr:unnamed protein product [Peronospora belbahrii]
MGAIEAKFSGDAKRAMLFLVRSVLEPVNLLAELFDTTLQGCGKNAYGLNALVQLRTRIQGVVSGEYCQLLLSTLDAAEVEFGASASVTTSACAGMSSSSTVVSGMNDDTLYTNSDVLDTSATVSGTSVDASGTSTTVSATIAAVGGAVVGSELVSEGRRQAFRQVLLWIRLGER